MMRHSERPAYLRAAGFLLVWAMTAATPLIASAEGPYTLREVRPAGSLRQIAVSFQVSGYLTMVADKEKQELKLPMSVDALLHFQEKVADAPEASDTAARSVRFCDGADVKIKVDDRPITPVLRQDRRLLSYTLQKGQIEIFSPGGPLTREERDLVDLPGDCLVAASLLPENPVRPGDKWQPADAALGALLGLDAVGQSQVSATLLEVKDGRAKIELTGTVHGAVGGVASHIELKARGYYSLAAHSLNDLELIYKEQRAIGHAGPGVDVSAHIRMQVAALKSSEQLSAAALSGVALEPSPERLRLQYEGAQRRFRLIHDPLWFVAREDATSSVLRRVERGELVAQCNVTALTTLPKDRRTTMEKFQEDTKKSLGDHFGEIVSAKESQDKTGRLVYRVEVAGKVADLPIAWIYYLVQDAEGRRTTLIFTLEETLAKQFANGDVPMVAALEMLTPPTGSEASPTPIAPAPTADNRQPPAKTTPTEASVTRPGLRR